jgi:hypothetical protein
LWIHNRRFPSNQLVHCRNEQWDKVLTIPSAHAHFKAGISESRVSQWASQRGSWSVVGDRRDDESRESTVNSRAPTEIVDGESMERVNGQHS